MFEKDLGWITKISYPIRLGFNVGLQQLNSACVVLRIFLSGVV